jgi:hypothetical protein
MSSNQVVIYKYGGRPQPGTLGSSTQRNCENSESQLSILARLSSSIVVARQPLPNPRDQQFYRPMSSGSPNMSGNYGNQNPNAKFTSEQIRQFREWDQDQLRTKALGFGLYNVPRSVEHEDWLQQQRSSANRDVGAMNLDESLVRQITRAEKIGSARLTFLNFSRATN